MKYKQSDFVVYHTKNAGEIFTWIKGVFDEQEYYILDFDNAEAQEEELSDYNSVNFAVPDAKGEINIDHYHRDTMIDRIVVALQGMDKPSNLKVSKLAETIIFETVIVDPELLKDSGKLQKLVDKYNKVIAKLQERFDKRWNVQIPVELHFPLQKIALHSIEI